MNVEERRLVATPFDQIGGEPQIQALVDRFYDLMDREPGLHAVHTAHGNGLDDARKKRDRTALAAHRLAW